jgi:hypothetical protein
MLVTAVRILAAWNGELETRHKRSFPCETALELGQFSEKRRAFFLSGMCCIALLVKPSHTAGY